MPRSKSSVAAIEESRGGPKATSIPHHAAAPRGAAINNLALRVMS